MKTRKSAVAGRFYPNDKNKIHNLLTKVLNAEKQKINTKLANNKIEILGGIVPHAGYMFSAYQAVHYFEILRLSKQKFDTFIIVNPNHTGYGKEISVDDNDFWEIPGGKIPVDKEFTEKLNLPFSSAAHIYEHSGEVMLPILDFFLDYKFKIVPVTISKQNYSNAKLTAERIYKTAKLLNRKIQFIASTDFSHFVSPEAGKKIDKKVINKILKSDAKGVIDTVIKNRISMCGYAPVASAMEYAKLISQNSKIELLRFGNSGEIMPSNEVVDYASFLIYRFVK